VHGVSHTTVCSLAPCPVFAPNHPSLHCFSTVRSRRQRSYRNSLYRRRVKHDADGGTEGLGREVVLELGADDTGVAVRTGDLAPDDADLGALDRPLCAVDVGYPLAGVPLSCLDIVDALKLEQRSSGVGVPLSFSSER
jgi:hypothetical protein